MMEATLPALDATEPTCAQRLSEGHWKPATAFAQTLVNKARGTRKKEPELEAEDLVQGALLKLMAKHPAIMEGPGAAGQKPMHEWVKMLYKMIRNRHIDTLREAQSWLVEYAPDVVEGQIQPIGLLIRPEPDPLMRLCNQEDLAYLEASLPAYRDSCNREAARRQGSAGTDFTIWAEVIANLMDIWPSLRDERFWESGIARQSDCRKELRTRLLGRINKAREESSRAVLCTRSALFIDSALNGWIDWIRRRQRRLATTGKGDSHEDERTCLVGPRGGLQ